MANNFAVAVQTTNSSEPHRVFMAQLPCCRTALADFAAARLLRPLTAVSDGLDCFTVAAGADVRERIVTGGGRASAKLPRFAAVNTILGNFKTGIAGTYHAFKFNKYAGCYLAEFRYCFNRRYNLHELLPRLVCALAAAKPRNSTLIRAPEVPCESGDTFYSGFEALRVRAYSAKIHYGRLLLSGKTLSVPLGPRVRWPSQNYARTFAKELLRDSV